MMMDPPTAEFASPFPPRTSWQLTLVRPDGQQVVFPLSDRLRIGRSDENELPLQDHEISRFHAMIEKVSDGYQIRDLGSTNGTFVNRTRIHVPVLIRLGDTITIGKFRLLVQRDSLICGHCAKLVKSDFLFCPHCGERLTGLTREQEAAKKKGTDQLRQEALKQNSPPPARAVPASSPASIDKDQRKDNISRPAPDVKPPERPRPVPPASVSKPSPVPSTPPKRSGAPVPARSSSPGPVAGDKKAVTEKPEARRQRIILGCAVTFVISLCVLAAVALAVNQLISQGVL